MWKLSVYCRKIYWTSTWLDGLYVSEMNGSFVMPLVKDVSMRCRGIAVHPGVGYVSIPCSANSLTT